MLNIADQQLSQANISHQLCQSDVNTLPFAEKCIDGVISAYMLEHLPNPAQGLQEMVRVLEYGIDWSTALTGVQLFSLLLACPQRS